MGGRLDQVTKLAGSATQNGWQIGLCLELGDAVLRQIGVSQDAVNSCKSLRAPLQKQKNAPKLLLHCGPTPSRKSKQTAENTPSDSRPLVQFHKHEAAQGRFNSVPPCRCMTNVGTSQQRLNPTPKIERTPHLQFASRRNVKDALQGTNKSAFQVATPPHTVPLLASVESDQMQHGSVDHSARSVFAGSFECLFCTSFFFRNPDSSGASGFSSRESEWHLRVLA